MPYIITFEGSLWRPADFDSEKRSRPPLNSLSDPKQALDQIVARLRVIVAPHIVSIWLRYAPFNVMFIPGLRSCALVGMFASVRPSQRALRPRSGKDGGQDVSRQLPTEIPLPYSARLLSCDLLQHLTYSMWYTLYFSCTIFPPAHSRLTMTLSVNSPCLPPSTAKNTSFRRSWNQPLPLCSRTLSSRYPLSRASPGRYSISTLRFP